MLETSFRSLLRNYASNGISVDRYWNQIHACYTEPHRQYHTLTHLNNMLNELTDISALLKKWNALLFALYYHDSVYDPLRTDNEERSTVLAKNAMTQLAVPDSIIKATVSCIMATRSHSVNDDPDINYFTDADLSVLGQAPVVYKTYKDGIRKEYSIYPDLTYQSGRKKVLSGFLQMNRIFKTEFFYNKYEAQARINITAEISAIDQVKRI